MDGAVARPQVAGKSVPMHLNACIQTQMAVFCLSGGAVQQHRAVGEMRTYQLQATRCGLTMDMK
jgi:hypothetical protein